jgi:nitroreductase
MEQNLEEIIKNQSLLIANINDGFSDFKYLILSGKELEYKEFLHEIFTLNDGKAYADFYYSTLSQYEKESFINALTEEEKVYFKKACKTDGIYFQLDHDLLDFLLSITIREVLFSTFYFCRIPAVVWGNYNMKFPMFFKDEVEKEIYFKLAVKCGLKVEDTEKGELDMIKELIKKSRSYRRFYGEKEITREQLTELVDLARLSPSGANRQPLKYILVYTPALNQKVYETLGWAGYLREWDGPIESERPTGYIIMLRDKTIQKTPSMDEGIAAQSIFLGATEMGLGGCYIGSFKKEPLNEILEISEDFEIALVIALGYPKEEVVLEKMGEDGDVKYWRDENQVHHVPKRSIEDIIIK